MAEHYLCSNVRFYCLLSGKRKGKTSPDGGMTGCPLPNGNHCRISRLRAPAAILLPLYDNHNYLYSSAASNMATRFSGGTSG